MAMPLETASPCSAKEMPPKGSLLLAEAVANELDDGLQGFVGPLALGFDLDLAAFGGGKHHHAHDALGVDPSPVAADPDLAGKLAGELGELGRGPRVQSELVDDFDFGLGHGSDTRGEVCILANLQQKESG